MIKMLSYLQLSTFGFPAGTKLLSSALLMTFFGAAGGAAGGAVTESISGFRCGDVMKKKYPMSPKKMKCWIRFLVKELGNHYEKCKTMLREEKKASLNKAKKKLESTTDENNVEIEELRSDSHIWNELASRLGSKEDSIKTTDFEFEKLLAE